MSCLALSTILPLLLLAVFTNTVDSLSQQPMKKIFPTIKLVLLDRDGVINEDVGAPGVLDISQFVLTPNAGPAILGQLKRRMKCNVVVITNQSCVGKGLIDMAQLERIHDYMETCLMVSSSSSSSSSFQTTAEHNNVVHDDDDYTDGAGLDKIYACTSTKEQNDPTMKPNPGMILQAMEEFNASPDECVFVGDTISDLVAATRAQVPLKILVSTGYGRSIMGRDVLEESKTENCGDDSGRIVELIQSLADCGGSGQSNSNASDGGGEDLPIPESIFPFYYTKNLASAVSFMVSLQQDELGMS
jgi:D-glycero-D-manno-heptose 1,7-bisphosphate phosphatase